MTLLESITEISEAKEFEIHRLMQDVEVSQRNIRDLKEQIVSLKNQNFKLKERLKAKSVNSGSRVKKSILPEIL